MATVIPPDLNPVSPESVELVDDSTQVFSPSLARGTMQRVSFGDPRWRIMRKYSAVRADDKARLATAFNEARGRFNTIRTTPGYVQRGSFPSQERLPNPTFANGITGWTNEASWTISVKDKVLRATRNQAGVTSFFVISNVVNGVTQFAPHVARFFCNLGASLNPAAFTARVDDYGTLAGSLQPFQQMITGVVVPITTQIQPAAAHLVPTVIPVTPGAYIDVLWASLTRCALVDTGVNLIPFSDTFSDSSWVKVNTSIGVNTTTAPDGTTTGDSLIEDAAAGTQHFIQTANLTIPIAPTEISCTIYVKANTRTWCHLAIVEFTGPTQAGAYFNLATGALGSVSNGTNMSACRSSIAPLGNGWYRISVTARKTNFATVIQPHLYLATSDGITSYDGNGVSSIFVWRAGIQIAFAGGVPNQTLGVPDTGTQYKSGTMNIKGLPASSAGTLLAGDYFEVNGELKRITAPVNSDAAGCATISFRPAMVAAPSDNDPVIFGNPMGRFLGSSIKWDSQWGLQEDGSITLDEVYE